MALLSKMSTTETDVPVQAPTPKTSIIATLESDRFIRLGLVKGMITNKKKTITNTIKEIEKAKLNVENTAKRRKDLSPESFFVKGVVFAVKDHIEQIQQLYSQLSSSTAEHNEILEQTKFSHPTKETVEECKALIEKAENELEVYSDKQTDANLDLIDFMDLYDK